MPLRRSPSSSTKRSGVKAAASKKPSKGVIKGNTSRDHIYRIFVIFSEVQNGRYPTLRNLADLCETSERTILRDIDQINGLLGNFETSSDGVGAPEDNAIEYDHHNGGYGLRRTLTHFPIIRVEERDLLTLHFLRQCLDPYRETGIGRMMIDSFNRTFGILVGTTDWKKWEKAVHFRFEGKPEKGKENVNLFELLHQAIRGNRVVSLDYKPAKEAKSTRLVEPHFLFMRNGSWYLFASKAGTSEKRILKFDRISNIKQTTRSFIPDITDPEDRFRYSFGVVPCESRARNPVVIEFRKESAQRVMETVWHPEQKLRKLSDGGVRLELPFAEPTYLELKPWILSWGSSAKVVSPLSLKDLVDTDIRAMARTLPER